MANINVGVFFKAPTITDPEYFAMRLIESIMGGYYEIQSYYI